MSNDDDVIDGTNLTPEEMKKLATETKADMNLEHEPPPDELQQARDLKQVAAAAKLITEMGKDFTPDVVVTPDGEFSFLETAPLPPLPSPTLDEKPALDETVKDRGFVGPESGGCFDEEERAAPELKVLDGGKAGDPPPRPPSNGKLPPFVMGELHYPGDVELDADHINKTWPPIEEVKSLTDLKLTPDMYPSDTGFFPAYMAWVNPTTDAPEPFHLATALGILTMTLNRGWMVEHTRPLYPNLFILMVATSGSRKSTALGPVKDLVRRSHFWPGPVASTRSFVDKLSGCQGTALWYFDEFTAFIEMLQSKSNADLIDRLNTAYGGDVIVYTSRAAGGDIIIPSPYLSIIAATTMESLRKKRLSEDFMRGGLWARFLMIPASRTKKLVDPPTPDGSQRERFSRWLDDVEKLEAPHGAFTLKLSYHARQEYAAYLTNAPAPTDPLLAGSWNRVGDLIKKLALLYHVASLRPADQEIELDSVQQAIRFVHYLALPGHLWAARRLLDASPFHNHMAWLEEYLVMEPAGIRYDEISRTLGVPPRFVSEIIASLYLSKRVTLWSWLEGTSGRPTCVVTAANTSPVRPGMSCGTDYVPKSVQKIIKETEALCTDDEEDTEDTDDSVAG